METIKDDEEDKAHVLALARVRNRGLAFVLMPKKGHAYWTTERKAFVKDKNVDSTRKA